MGKRKGKGERQLDSLFSAKALAEEAAPRLMAKAIARFEKAMNAPCKGCGGRGVLEAKVEEEVITRDCPTCGGDGAGAGLGKEDIMFLRFLQSAALHKERLMEELGLNPKQLAGGGGQHPMLAIFAKGNIDVRAFKNLSDTERQQMLLDMAGGKTPTLPVVEVKPDGGE